VGPAGWLAALTLWLFACLAGGGGGGLLTGHLLFLLLCWQLDWAGWQGPLALSKEEGLAGCISGVRGGAGGGGCRGAF